jgi:hypothetical protein
VARFLGHKGVVEAHAHVMSQHEVLDETVEEDAGVVSCTVAVAVG